MSQEVATDRSARHSSSRQTSQLLVTVAAGLAAIGGVVAGCRPTGTLLVDPVETAIFAAGFTLLVSRSSRATWLLLGVVSVLLARGWLLVPAVLTMGLAFMAVFGRRTRRRFGAVLGALGVQVVLRWPPAQFHGFPSLVAAALVVIIGVSAWRRSTRRIRRRALVLLGGAGAVALIVSVPALIAALGARGDAFAAEAEAHSALATIGNGSQAVVTKELRGAATESRTAAGMLGHWYLLGARLVPVVAQQDRFLEDTTRQAAHAAAVGAAESPAIDYHRLEYHDGQVNLSRLASMELPMARLRTALASTSEELAQTASAWLFGPLQHHAESFQGDVERALHTATLGVEAARELPAMLGGDGTRNYLVAFMTPSESRGYDGLVGSYGVLTATDGRVHLSFSGSIADLQGALPSGGARLTDLPDFLARYGAFHPGRFPQDAGYSPDLPTMARVLDEMDEQAGGPRLDGVLALDPLGLAALLHFTGPVEVSGLPFPLTQANAAKVLLTEQYTTFDTGATNQDILRHDFLQGALHAAFDKLVSGSLPAPRELAAVLSPVAAEGRISFWSFHRAEQPFLRELGIDGSFPGAGVGDLLAVTTQNAGNNKIDAFLHTSVLDEVTFDPSNGDLNALVTIHLRNAAPPTGLPPIVIDSPADPGLAPGTNRTWLTVYSPLVADRVTVDGHPGSASSGPELGVRAYSLYVDVAPDSTATVTVSLSGTVAARGALPVSVRVQPSANPQAVVVEVAPTSPWHLTTQSGSGTWVLSADMRQRRTFSFAQG